MKTKIILLALFISAPLHAGAFKCTDEHGKTTYQENPCSEEKDAVEINLKTGTLITNEAEQRQKALEDQKKQLQLNEQQQIAKLKVETKQQSDLNQALIKEHPQRFSAYAIPPYTLENMPESVKHYQWHLPKIERLRRLTAIRVLNDKQCDRVEAVEFNSKSTLKEFVFLIDCRSGAQIFVSENELKKQ